MPKALEGVRVVEVADLVAGPFCARLLGDFGADVTKIEPPGVGDSARRRGPFYHDVPHPDRSALFMYVNTNKRSVTLDIASAQGREIFRRLIADADILVTDRSPRETNALGLTYKHLKKVNPRLIAVAVTPFGLTGPRKDYKAHPMNVYHAGGDGYLLQSGEAYLDRAPIKAAGMAGEYQGGWNAASAALIALYARNFSGVGQQVDVSKQEALMGLNRMILGRYPNEGVVEQRASRHYDFLGIFPCRDGHMIIMAFDDHHWKTLADLVGRPDWKTDPEYGNRGARTRHRKDINAYMTEWLKDKSGSELYHKWQKAHCPVGWFASPEDVVKSEQLKARNFFTTLDHPGIGPLVMPSVPYQFSGTPAAYERSAPSLGQDNEAVFCQRLGIPREEMTQLREAGVI